VRRSLYDRSDIHHYAMRTTRTGHDDGEQRPMSGETSSHETVIGGARTESLDVAVTCPRLLRVVYVRVYVVVLLDEVGYVERHFLDLSVVELFDLSHRANVVGGDEVDGDSLTTETTGTTDTVDVVLLVRRHIVVNDE